MEDVVLFAPLGPNPAPLAELIWGLYRQDGRRVVSAYVVANTRARLFLQREFLAEGAALDALRTCLGPEILTAEDVHVIPAETPEGHLIEDDAAMDAGRAYHGLIFRGALRAMEAAGARPLVFGLVSGRRRTMVAAQTTVFQLLGRPQDRLLDTRVSDRRAEGGVGFFFPEQPTRYIDLGDDVLDATTVTVDLVDVPTPRLAGLLPTDLPDFERALLASQIAIDHASPPELVVDMEKVECRVNGTPVTLSLAQFLWYATLVHARLHTAEGWVAADTLDPLVPIVTPLYQAGKLRRLRSKPLLFPLGETPPGYSEIDALENIRSLRSRTSSALRAFCRDHLPHHQRLLVPEQWRDTQAGTVHKTRLALPAAQMRVVG